MITADAEFETIATPRRRRRWLALALLAVAAIAIAYALSPVIGAVRLLDAARRGDVADVASRVNLAKLRRSVARQLVTEAVRSRSVQGPERHLALGAGTAAVAVLLEEQLTPRNLADLLGGREIAPGGSDATAAALDLSPLRPAPAGTMVEIWWRSGFTGLRSYDLVLPRAGDREGVRLGLELQGTTWRLDSLILPEDIRQEMARRIAAIVQRGQP